MGESQLRRRTGPPGPREHGPGEAALGAVAAQRVGAILEATLAYNLVDLRTRTDEHTRERDL